MKKMIYFILIFICSFYLFSNEIKKIDLESNEYYKLALEKINLAKEAYNKGEYDASFSYSEEARELLRKADELNLLKVYIINSEKRKEIAQSYIEKLDLLKAKEYPETQAFYEKAKITYEDGLKAIEKAQQLTEIPDKINSYASSINLFSETVNLAKSAISKIALDFNTAKDLLDKAKSKRNELLSFKIIKENDENDNNIVKILKESENALNDKDFALSVNKSREAISYMENIQLDYIATLKKQAQDKLEAANTSYNNAISKDAEKLYPDKMQEAKQFLENAKLAFENSKYAETISESDKVLKIISELTFEKAPIEEKEKIVYPKYYTVRLNLKKRDCFWRIAAFPFVYNDPFKWKLLYEANKNKLKDPNNPHLIFPGMIMEIPSLYGEIREGEYDPTKDYPPLKKK